MGLFSTSPVEKYGREVLNRLPLGISIYRLEDAQDPASMRVVYSNPASGTLTGLNIEKETGRRLVEIVPELRETGVLDIYVQVLREQAPRDLGTVVYGDDRIPKSTYSVRAFPLDERTLAVVFEDISERTEVQQLQATRAEMEREEVRYRTLIDTTAAIVWTTPPSGELQTDQVQWQRVTGQTPDESAGQGWLDAIHPDDRADTLAAWSHAVDTREPYRVEHRLRQADGSYRRMAVSATPILDDQDGVVEWVGIHTDIHAQAEAAAELAASEARFRTLFDAISDVLLVYPLGVEGPEPFLAFNQAALERYGYTADQLRTMTVSDLVMPGRVNIHSSLDELRRTRRATFDSVHLTRDGDRLAMSTSARLVEYDGRLCVVALCRDDTDRRQFRREIARANRALEAAVEERTAQLEAFSEDLKLLHGITTAEHVSTEARYRAYLTAGCEMFDLPNGILSEIYPDPDSGEMLYRIQAVVSPDPALRPEVTVPLSETFCDAVMETGGTVAYADASAENPTNAACATRGLRAFIGAPVLVGSTMVGTLNFASPEPRSEPFSASERDLIEVMAQAIGRRIEADRAEAERDESRERYRTIVETVDAGVIVVDHELRVIMSNPSARELLGLDVDHGDDETDHLSERWPIVGLDHEPLGPDDLPEREALRTGLPVRGAIQGILPPGREVRWYRVNATPVDHDDDGHPDAVVVSFHDVTDLRMAVEAAEQAQDLLRSVLAATPEGVMAFEAARDDDGRIVDFRWTVANPRACEIVGRDPQSLVGQTLLGVFPGNREAGLFDAYVEVVESGQPFETLIPYTADGLDTSFRLTAVPLARIDGFTVTFAEVMPAEAIPPDAE